MHFSALFLLTLAFLFDACTSECQVCVLEPLITSPVKCPICPADDEIYSKRGNEGNSRRRGNNYGERKSHINWTTCSVAAEPCDPSSKYRTFDGSCNNLKEPTRGMTNTVYIRLLPPQYGDNKHTLALGSDGQPKPLARTLRTQFFPDKDNPDRVALSVMQFGQVVAHDIISSIPVASIVNTDCCSPPNSENQSLCLPVRIPENDYFYSQYNVSCLRITRNNFSLIGDCDENQPAQQYNGVTHPIDGSLVYGSNLVTANSIREFVGGRLKIQRLPDGRSFPPNLPPDQSQTQCFVRSAEEPCYTAGDDRVNQNPQLTVLQILLLREHNRIAGGLQELHANWSDERIYQEARAIVIAIIQHITYKEWLVYYVGDSNMRKFNLYPRKLGYTQYNSKVNLASINSFAAAAYRFAHSGIQGFLKMLNYLRQLQGEVPISDWMIRPLIVQQNSNFDQFLLGLTDQPMQIFERYFTEQMTNLMFHNDTPTGVDLLAIDIERGRDHGIAPYVHYLEICTGYRAETFEDLYQFIHKALVDKLKTYYKSVQDIDLMVGAGLEIKVENTRFGPTFLCINTEQFYRKKWGDRFWYEVGEQPHSFTKAQLKEIRKATFSRVICYNSDNITTIAVNSFVPPSRINKIVPCSTLPAIDLNMWK